MAARRTSSPGSPRSCFTRATADASPCSAITSMALARACSLRDRNARSIASSHRSGAFSRINSSSSGPESPRARGSSSKATVSSSASLIRCRSKPSARLATSRLGSVRDLRANSGVRSGANATAASSAARRTSSSRSRNRAATCDTSLESPCSPSRATAFCRTFQWRSRSRRWTNFSHAPRSGATDNPASSASARTCSSRSLVIVRSRSEPSGRFSRATRATACRRISRLAEAHIFRNLANRAIASGRIRRRNVNVRSRTHCWGCSKSPSISAGLTGTPFSSNSPTASKRQMYEPSNSMLLARSGQPGHSISASKTMAVARTY